MLRVVHPSLRRHLVAEDLIGYEIGLRWWGMGGYVGGRVGRYGRYWGGLFKLHAWGTNIMNV